MNFSFVMLMTLQLAQDTFKPLSNRNERRERHREEEEEWQQMIPKSFQKWLHGLPVYRDKRNNRIKIREISLCMLLIKAGCLFFPEIISKCNS